MSSITASGITLSPAIEQLTLNAGQTSYSFTAYAANHTGQPVTLELSPVDFTPSNDFGGVAFAGSSVTSVDNPHGLASWIRISPSKITLLPGGSQPFEVSLTGTDTLRPGGHYAAIVLKLASSSNKPVSNRVQVNQDVSLLLFTTTNGSGMRDISLAPPGTGVAWFHMPQTLNLFLTDNGNTQVTPRGYTTIFSSNNKPISRSLVNSGSALVLPGSTRLLETPTNAKTKPFWPGVYHLQVAYNFDGSAKMNYYNANFVYVSWPFVVIVAGLLLALVVMQLARKRISRKYRLRH